MRILCTVWANTDSQRQIFCSLAGRHDGSIGCSGIRARKVNCPDGFQADSRLQKTK